MKPNGRKEESFEEDISDEDILVDGKYYQGNDNILRKDGTFKWTPERVSDFKLCHKSILHFAENHFYITALDRGKEKIVLYKYQKRLLKAFKSNRFNVVLSSRQSGKALDINTPIPTPNGYVKMGELKEGDQIYGLDGKIYNIIKAHEYLYNRPCYKVIFDNGEEIIADGDHLWFTQERNERKNDIVGSVKTTEKILSNLTVGKKKEPRHRIPMVRNGLEGNGENLFPINNQNTWHYIKEIIPVESRPVRCISVDSPDNLYLCGNTLIPTHNSTTITIYALWLACFQSDKRITIVANKEATAKEIFARVKLAYEQLPIHIKPAMKSWRKDGFQLSNDSEIKISTTSASAARGSSSNLLIIDEMAHCPPEVMKELWKSAIPIITASEKSQIVVISTPNGTDNKFYELCEEAKKEKSSWNLERVEWTDVPGRDENWKKMTIDLLGGSIEDFDQEYGNVFIAPGKSLIDEKYLSELKSQCVDPVLVTDDGCYKIFHLPNPDSIYVVGVDVGEGIGRSNTVAQIFDISNLQNIQQVAVYASNNINPYHFGSRLMNILNDWGRPPVLVESNNYGQQVLDVLHQAHNYENIVTHHLEGNSKHYRTEMRRGIFNHTNTRYNGITNFRYWSNSLKAVIFNDPETLFELNSFVKLPNHTYNKRSDKDLDDRVFGCIWSLFILVPNLVVNYFHVLEYDDQGRPNKISSLHNNKDLILKSPLLSGSISNSISIKNRPTNLSPAFISPKSSISELDMARESNELWMWLHTSAFNEVDRKIQTASKDPKNLPPEEEYRPLILF